MLSGLFCLCIIMYWAFEAVTEALVWYKDVCNKPKLNPFYHSARLLETAGVTGAILSSAYLTISFLSFYFLFIGSWLIGWVIYEGILTTSSGSPFWVKLYPYHVGFSFWEITFTFKRWMFIISAIIGIILVYLSIGGVI